MTSDKEKKKGGLFLSPDQSNEDSDDSEGSKVKVQEDVLVISLGVVTECPGMMLEQKVSGNIRCVTPPGYGAYT